jgi:hypothetical protein
MDTPAPVPVKPVIDQSASLRSLLRSWLAHRDAVIWTLVAGVTPDAVLEHIDLTGPAADAVATMNGLRDMALKLAAQIGRDPQLIIETEMADLLAAEEPKFVLRVVSYPGSF